MALKVYGIPMSTCTARVLSSIYEKEADFQIVPVNLQAGEHKQPSYLATKNPFGQIPALEDGDLTLSESRAITKYVATKYDKGTDLLRLGNLKESAMVGVWLEVEAQTYNPPISVIVYQLVILPKFGGTPKEEVIKTNEEKLAKVLDVYEERLSKSKYLAGDFYSLADLHHVPYTYYMMKTPKASLINSRPHVKAWWEDIMSRPAIKKATEGMTLA
ncbi:glutathione S-transferase F13-like [Tasmannia lanceolata]|uniref:glutathione S-transferase F13-like n=1 Tax=Tasmannia lanceolata TaxID=3420 RepID=UPI004062CD32